MPFFRAILGLPLTAALCWAALANAQESDSTSEPANESQAVEATIPPRSVASDDIELPDELFQSQAMEEIIVFGGPQARSEFNIEMDREAQLRESLYEDLEMRQRDAEDIAWRQADPDLENDSRYKWGYSAQAELRMRYVMDDIHDLPIDKNKPATIFRAEF